MKKSTEDRIKWKTLTLYTIIAVVLCGLILYMYDLHKNFSNQKKIIKEHTQSLSGTNRFILTIQDAQAEANLYAVTGNSSHLKQFKRAIAAANHQIDSLSKQASYKFQLTSIQKIRVLLSKKESVIRSIGIQKQQTDPLQQLNKQIQELKSPTLHDYYYVSTTKKDTFISRSGKKGFWKRIGEAIKNSPTDKNLNISTTKVDTLRLRHKENSPKVAEVHRLSEQASDSISKKFNTIRGNIKLLVSSDQTISIQISNLLIDLHRQTLQSAANQIAKSEKLFYKNFILSVVTGVLAALLILLFVYLIINDVNESRKTKAELEKQKKHAEEIMESRHKLLLSVSHDIKAPLSSIIGYLDLWGNKPVDSSEKSRIAAMQNSSNHILSLVSNLLEFASLEKGSLSVNNEPFIVADLCEEIHEMFLPIARQKGLTLTSNIDISSKLSIKSDKLKLAQIISNLVSNAIKYTPQGEVSLYISEHNHLLKIEVKDTGLGIPDDKVDDLFNAFTRIEGSNNIAEGSGFGMYVVKGLVNLLKGSISVSSEVGIGTSITVYLPLEKCELTGSEMKENKEGIIEEPLHILAIDDDKSILGLLEEMILRIGCIPTICSTTKEFDKALQISKQFDYIITDMEMGSIKGTNILSKIKALGINIPVIIMTARANYTLSDAVKEGFHSFIPKPFTLNNLKNIFTNTSNTAQELMPKSDSRTPLEDMFGDDLETIKTVVSSFVESSTGNFERLKEAIQSNNFTEAQSLCHKMVPMFIQMGAKELSKPLVTMDSLKGKSPTDYPSWNQDLTTFLVQAKFLITELKAKYQL